MHSSASSDKLIPLAISLIFAALAILPSSATAQDLEPRRWSHLPMGSNFGGAAYAYTTGQISVDPVLQIENAEMDMHTGLLSYIHPFALFNRSARIDIRQGYTSVRWQGTLRDAAAATRRTGLTDTVVRFAVNLIGAPPLEGEEFAAYRAGLKSETIVGLALAVHLPTGNYLEERLLNIGSNRFTFVPQLGVVHNRGKWSFELTAASWIFTENDEFFGGNQLEQDPLYTVQGHLVYTFRPGLWLATGAGYGYGSESTINGIAKDDRRETFIWGARLGVPINRNVGMNLSYIGTRTQTSLGSDTDTLSIGLSVMW